MMGTICSYDRININVIPSFGRIVNMNEYDKNQKVLINLFRFMMYKPGEEEKEPFTNDLQTLTHLDMFLLALGK